MSILPDSGDPRNIAIDLVSTTFPLGRKVKTYSDVRSLAFSVDGRYLAIGESSGRVTLRDMSDLASGKRLVAFNIGKGVPVTSIIWLQRDAASSVFIGAGNGFLNCVTFVSDDFIRDHPRKTAVRVSGLITNLAINPDGTQIAVSYDYATRIFPLPFPEGEPTQHGAGNGFLINQDIVRPGAPIREHPRALSLCYLDKYTLLVSFFSRIQAFTTDPASRIKDKLWELRLPEDISIGSLSVSPCGKLAAARSLTGGGVEWFSLITKQRVSTTKIEDDYSETNAILPIQFLTDKSFVTGNNRGKIVTGTHGVDRVQRHESTTGIPSQYLTVSRTAECVKVAFASGDRVKSRIYTLLPTPTPKPTGSLTDPSSHIARLPSHERPTSQPDDTAGPTKQRKVSFGKPEFMKATAANDSGEDGDDGEDDIGSLDSTGLDGFHTAAQTPAHPRSKFPTHGLNTGDPPAFGLPRSRYVHSREDFLTSTPTRRAGSRSRSPPPPLPKLLQSNFVDDETSNRGGEDSVEFARTNIEELGAPPEVREQLWLGRDRQFDEDDANSDLEYIDYDAQLFHPPNIPPQPIGTIHSPAASHEELAEGEAADGGQGDEDPPERTTDKDDIYPTVEAVKALLECAYTSASMNPKIMTIIVLSLLACAFAVLLGRPSPITSGVEIAVPSSEPHPNAAHVGSNDVVDEGGDPEDDGYEEGGEIEGCDTIVLTDTKVITITRTITNTVTSTVTEVPRSTRRAQKSRRRKSL